MLTIPIYADVVYGTVGANAVSPLVLAFSYTPAHLLWAGQEAVFLFFILSGFVLALPVMYSRAFSWKSYYPRRAVRIYGPVIAAVAFGLLIVAVVPRQGEGLGAWIDARPTAPTLVGTLRDISLVFGPSRLISPLWSLRWEVIFSILLPIYVLASVKYPRLDWLKVIVILAVMVAGVAFEKAALIYLPMFAFGTLAATNRESLSRLAARIGRSGWVALLVLGICLATSRWTLGLTMSTDVSSTVSVVPAFLGCSMLVFAAAFWRPAIVVLERPASQWLGKVSFSLYLTHEPIVIACAFLFGGGASWLVPVVATPLSFAVAWAFFRWVEAPCHRLARRVGKAVSAPEPRLVP